MSNELPIEAQEADQTLDMLHASLNTLDPLLLTRIHRELKGIRAELHLINIHLKQSIGVDRETNKQLRRKP